MNKFKIFKYHLEEPETTLDLPIGAVVHVDQFVWHVFEVGDLRLIPA